MLQRHSIAAAALSLVGLSLLGCGGGGEPLSYEPSYIEETSGPCGKDGDEACGRVSLEWPVFDGEADPDVAARLNAAARGMILTPVFDDDPLTDPAGLVDQFLDQWEKTRREFPGAASVRNWFLERRVQVRYLDVGAVTLLATDNSFTGGAHGMLTRRYSSYDPATGLRLHLEDVIKPRKWDAFEALAGRRFRDARGLGADVDLAKAGFDFGSLGIAPDDNWGVVEDGMIFRFNPYDIAAYAMGPTEYRLTREELKGMLR
jgi:hypothetical protein